MRKSKDAKAESRERILAEASRLFRERGLARVGVAEVMDAAGMTHGGFYRHFQSKEALIAEAVSATLKERADSLAPSEGCDAAETVAAYVSDYLSVGHVTHPGMGCAIAMTGSEAAHAVPEAAPSFVHGVEALIGRLQAGLGSPDRGEPIRLLATLVGAVVIARAVGDADLREEVLSAAMDDGTVRNALRPQYK